MHGPPRRAASDEQDEADRQTASLAALALTLVLVVVGLYIARTLRAGAAAQDCVLAGQADCLIVADD